MSILGAFFVGFILVFFSDILIYSSTIKIQQQHLNQAFDILQENRL